MKLYKKFISLFLATALCTSMFCGSAVEQNGRSDDDSVDELNYAKALLNGETQPVNEDPSTPIQVNLSLQANSENADKKIVEIKKVGDTEEGECYEATAYIQKRIGLPNRLNLIDTGEDSFSDVILRVSIKYEKKYSASASTDVYRMNWTAGKVLSVSDSQIVRDYMDVAYICCLNAYKDGEGHYSGQYITNNLNPTRYNSPQIGTAYYAYPHDTTYWFKLDDSYGSIAGRATLHISRANSGWAGTSGYVDVYVGNNPMW